MSDRINGLTVTLAKRLIACKHFRWLPGMLAVRVEEPVCYSEGAGPSHLLGRTYRVLYMDRTVHCYGEAFDPTSTAFLPDLSDPATLGCLLALVRAVHGPCTGLLVPLGVWRVVKVEDLDTIAHGPDEASALVAALEAR